MIPPLSRGVVGLHTAILNGEQIRENALLDHRLAEQSAAITSASPQLLASSLHALVLALELEFVCTALLGLEQLPGAMDSPVTEVAVSREAQRAGSKRMVEEVADKSYRMALVSVRLFRVRSCDALARNMGEPKSRRIEGFGRAGSQA